MVRFFTALVVGVVCLLVALPVAADWVPADGHKMHFPQFPNEYGWNVYASQGVLLADDWQCSESGPVNDIHFWGSWKNGLVGQINSFTITIYDDIPADQSPTGYSMPGGIAWGPVVITEFTARHIIPDPQAWEGWMDASDGTVLPYDHDNYYQYNIMDIGGMAGVPAPFEQVLDGIYWLAITANVEPDASQPQPEWGWKSSYLHFNDDAVIDQQGWQELYEPDLGFVFNNFSVTANEIGDVVEGWGEYAWGDGWYLYTDDPANNWWNVWFYDHPLATDRWKEIHLAGSVRTMIPGGQGGWISIVVNWTTPAWSIEGNPPGEPRRPPLDADLSGLALETYLVRSAVLWEGPVDDIPTELPASLGWDVSDYNPEWVSVDVRGWNFIFDGAISHACVGLTPQSMDMAFVITNTPGEPTGACCHPDGTCTSDLTLAACESDGVSVYMGDGTVCLGDADGDGNDDLCVIPEPTGACCYDDGSCADGLTSANCIASGGEYGGDGSLCAGTDNNGNGVDDFCDGVVTLGACCYGPVLSPLCVNTTQSICEAAGGYAGTWYTGEDCATFTCPTPQTGACCFTDGSCLDLTAADCQAASGIYQGDGTVCLGDFNPANGIDDACEVAEDLKWLQPPDLTSLGFDVMATEPVVLADDFECTQTGPITKVEAWGSWWADEYPLGGPGDVSFTLSIHEDIPSTSTVTYPAPCPYVTLGTPLTIIDGLPPGTTIDVHTWLDNYMNILHEPGGQLGGEIVYFDATLNMEMTGTGTLTGFTRILSTNVQVEVHTACVPPDPCLDYEMRLISLQGEVIGDPDFDLLRVIMGENYGLPSPGHTTLTKLPTGDFNVDSFFDITYQIEFQGAPGSILSGMAGVTTGSSRLTQAATPAGGSCVVPDEGEYSRPGEAICFYDFGPGGLGFTVEPVELIDGVEGWFDPITGVYQYPGDHNCYKYTFVLPGDCIQTGTVEVPKVYWVDLQARVEAAQTVWFGWKTARTHWNDDAVWGNGVQPPVFEGPWSELWYPEGHQFYGQSIDLAFAVYGDELINCCQGRVGDANNSGDDEPTIGDVSIMIDALYISGDWSLIPCLPEADVNQTGGLNPTTDDITIGDVSYLIDYLFITGPDTAILPDCL